VEPKLELFIRAVIACIQADDKIDKRELEIFRAILQSLDLEDDSVAYSWLEEPQVLNPSRLRRAFVDLDDRARILKSVVAVAMADGELKLEEVTFVGDFLAALGISYEELHAMSEDDDSSPIPSLDSAER
jgi:tellurite resistance protein